MRRKIENLRSRVWLSCEKKFREIRCHILNTCHTKFHPVYGRSSLWFLEQICERRSGFPPTTRLTSSAASKKSCSASSNFLVVSPCLGMCAPVALTALSSIRSHAFVKWIHFFLILRDIELQGCWKDEKDLTHSKVDSDDSRSMSGSGTSKERIPFVTTTSEVGISEKVVWVMRIWCGRA